MRIMRVQITADVEVKNLTEAELRKQLPRILEDLFLFGYDPKVDVAVRKVEYPEG